MALGPSYSPGLAVACRAALEKAGGRVGFALGHIVPSGRHSAGWREG